MPGNDTIAWLARAGGGGGPLDWLVCLVLAVIAVVQLVGLVDGRLPLLTADEQGYLRGLVTL